MKTAQDTHQTLRLSTCEGKPGGDKQDTAHDVIFQAISTASLETGCLQTRQARSSIRTSQAHTSTRVRVDVPSDRRRFPSLRSINHHALPCCEAASLSSMSGLKTKAPTQSPPLLLLHVSGSPLLPLLAESLGPAVLRTVSSRVLPTRIPVQVPRGEICGHLAIECQLP